jgi:bile acid-coenzyme A ligase
VIGLTDAEWGRRVHAIVQLDDGATATADELTAYASERIARYKVPKSVEFIDKIPRTEATKLNRASLIAEREQAAEQETDT